MRREPLTDLVPSLSRLRVRDVVRESFTSLVGHPTRSALTAIGTVLGSAAFVATLGLSSTLAQQVSDSFDARRATEVIVSLTNGPTPATFRDQAALPAWQDDKALNRARGLNGVVSAGRRVQFPETHVFRGARTDSGDSLARVTGIDSDGLRVIKPHIVLGRTFDAFHDRAASPVALIPDSLARRLSITRTDVAIFISDRPYVVIGIFDDVERRPESLQSVLVPFQSAAPILMSSLGSGAERDVLLETAQGAAQLVASQIALSLYPEDSRALRVNAPPDPVTLRREIEGNVATLTLVLSVVSLAIGGVSIGTAATAQIATRRGEIGLRRAVGARPRHIFAQLLTETTFLGLFGGIAGSLAGMIVTVIVAVVNEWQPILSMPIALAAASLGGAAGAIAGLVPAWRATRIEPVDALQR